MFHKKLKSKKRARKLEKLAQADQTNVEYNPSQGINGTRLVEALPRFIKTDSEKVYKNENNAWIVLGRDRPAGIESGYGGQGYGQCGSIDLVVGRLASRQVGQMPDSFVDPSFETDAARIYITQRGDIDTYLNLVDGSIGQADNRSGIAIKADGVRVVAREGIKLVSSMPEDLSVSEGDDVQRSKYGIDLITGNTDENNFLQPIPKGKYLNEALVEITKAIDETNKILNSFITMQMDYNSYIAFHGHYETPIPAPPSLSLGLAFTTKCPGFMMNGYIPSGWTSRVNLSALRWNYLRSGSKRWINSKYNRTT